MIEYLRGQVAYAESDYLVLDVQGVGYQIYCGNPFRFDHNQELTIYTHHHVREDAITLYGFVSREELALFRQLLDVSGIGPKVALGILNGGSPKDVLLAIHQENVAFLTRLPGIGKKTAQRMILDLKDKTKAFVDSVQSFANQHESQLGAVPSSSGTLAEVKDALRSLGYSELECARVLATLKEQNDEQASVDVLLKKALQLMFQG
jgi:Holliday junction DNA helicase RuvA